MPQENRFIRVGNRGFDLNKVTWFNWEESSRRLTLGFCDRSDTLFHSDEAEIIWSLIVDASFNLTPLPVKSEQQEENHEHQTR